MCCCRDVIGGAGYDADNIESDYNLEKLRLLLVFLYMKTYRPPLFYTIKLDVAAIMNMLHLLFQGQSIDVGIQGFVTPDAVPA